MLQVLDFFTWFNPRALFCSGGVTIPPPNIWTSSHGKEGLGERPFSWDDIIIALAFFEDIAFDYMHA